MSAVGDYVLGTEWIVDAHGCDPCSLRACDALGRLFARIVDELGLQPIGEPVWHVFPGPGGITGLLLLSESHLACHTFPERGFAAFDLYCCRESHEWPWAERLADTLGAAFVRVRSVPRGEREPPGTSSTIPHDKPASAAPPGEIRRGFHAGRDRRLD